MGGKCKHTLVMFHVFHTKHVVFKKKELKLSLRYLGTVFIKSKFRIRARNKPIYITLIVSYKTREFSDTMILLNMIKID